MRRVNYVEISEFDKKQIDNKLKYFIQALEFLSGIPTANAKITTHFINRVNFWNIIHNEHDDIIKHTMQVADKMINDVHSIKNIKTPSELIGWVENSFEVFKMFKSRETFYYDIGYMLTDIMDVICRHYEDITYQLQIRNLKYL